MSIQLCLCDQEIQLALLSLSLWIKGQYQHSTGKQPSGRSAMSIWLSLRILSDYLQYISWYIWLYSGNPFPFPKALTSKVCSIVELLTIRRGQMEPNPLDRESSSPRSFIPHAILHLPSAAPLLPSRRGDGARVLLCQTASRKWASRKENR